MLPFWPVPSYCLTESFAILTIGSYKLVKASSSPLLKLGHYSKVSGDCRWDSSLLKTSRVPKESFALVAVCLLKIPMGNKDCSTIQGPLKRGLLYDSGTEKNTKVEKVNGLHGPLPRAFDTIAGKIDKSGDDYDTVPMLDLISICLPDFCLFLPSTIWGFLLSQVIIQIITPLGTPNYLRPVWWPARRLSWALMPTFTFPVHAIGWIVSICMSLGNYDLVPTRRGVGQPHHQLKSLSTSPTIPGWTTFPLCPPGGNLRDIT